MVYRAGLIRAMVDDDIRRNTGLRSMCPELHAPALRLLRIRL